jgi:hypothetical protein
VRWWGRSEDTSEYSGVESPRGRVAVVHEVDEGIVAKAIVEERQKSAAQAERRGKHYKKG